MGPARTDLVGSIAELDVGPVAHGGHCVARWDGRVVFVRHCLPGERVRARVTAQTTRFLRADAVEVLRPTAGRVSPRCPVSGPGGCGGCDFQHVDLPTQRDLLARVVSEQLRRIAGVEREVVVEAVGPDDDPRSGLDWRTRTAFTARADGRLGLHRHRSHEVIALEECPIAHPDLPDVLSQPWPAGRVETVVAASGDRLVLAEGVRGVLPAVRADGVLADAEQVRGRTYVRERVHHREFRVSRSGFWQVHPRAATVLVDAVLEMARPGADERIVDLYAGVGLFAAFLGERVGAAGRVVAVEGDRRAASDARRNLYDLAQVRLVGAAVDRSLGRGGQVEGLLTDDTHEAGCDAVVLDPPRTGARLATVRGVTALRPSRVVYVACDPAALARDVGTFADHGYAVTALRAFDLFPMTHHVECVALLEPT